MESTATSKEKEAAFWNVFTPDFGKEPPLGDITMSIDDLANWVVDDEFKKVLQPLYAETTCMPWWVALIDKLYLPGGVLDIVNQRARKAGFSLHRAQIGGTLHKYLKGQAPAGATTPEFSFTIKCTRYGEQRSVAHRNAAVKKEGKKAAAAAAAAAAADPSQDQEQDRDQQEPVLDAPAAAAAAAAPVKDERRRGSQKTGCQWTLKGLFNLVSKTDPKRGVTYKLGAVVACCLSHVFSFAQL
jgi:hypothetical protein